MSRDEPKVRLSFLVASVGIAGLVLAVGLTLGPTTVEPVATWQFGAERRAVEPFTSVPRFDPMRLSVTLPSAAWVYVASFDYEHGATAYFPSDYLGTDRRDGGADAVHHLPAGTHELPGPWGEKTEQAWYVPGVQEALVAEDPERFFRPPYVGPSGWIGVRIDRRPDWRIVAGLVKDAYRTIAPAKLVARLDASAGRTKRGWRAGWLDHADELEPKP